MTKAWPYYDYAYKPYTPLTACRGKLSSDQLFYNACAGSPRSKDYGRLARALQKELGAWSVVWGAKLCQGELSWELYFYDHGLQNPRMTAVNVLKVLQPFFSAPAGLKKDVEKFPYFMFSVDVSDRILADRAGAGVHLYTRGRRGVFQGNSYMYDANGWRLENTYDFYRMPMEAKDCVHKMMQGMVLSRHRAAFLKHELVRRLMDCGTVCVANKPSSDGVYFSRVNVDQLVVFLKWFAYPVHILDYVQAHQNKLDHLLFDVALDAALDAGKVVFTKSSYYSIL